MLHENNILLLSSAENVSGLGGLGGERLWAPVFWSPVCMTASVAESKGYRAASSSV